MGFIHSHRGICNLQPPSNGVPNRDFIGRMKKTPVINESSLYALIFGSKLESAKRFKHWVTSEVLPALRKVGRYDLTTGKGRPSFLEVSRSLKIEPSAPKNQWICLNPAVRCAILRIEKGKAIEAAYPLIATKLTFFNVSRQLFPVVGGYFLLSLNTW